MLKKIFTAKRNMMTRVLAVFMLCVMLVPVVPTGVAATTTVDLLTEMDIQQIENAYNDHG